MKSGRRRPGNKGRRGAHVKGQFHFNPPFLEVYNTSRTHSSQPGGEGGLILKLGVTAGVFIGPHL